MPTRRIPHLGHTLLFLLLLILSFLLAEAVVLAISGGLGRSVLASLQSQPLQLATTALAYLVTLAAAYFSFPALWDRPFLSGLQWNWRTARRFATRLLPLGLLLGFALQAVEQLIPNSKAVPMEEYFRTVPMVWALTFFGTLLAPLFEETLFRGFLLPATATAVDWLRLPRTPDALQLWSSSDAHTPFALVTSSLLTSMLFALIHAPQLGYNWPTVALLAAVSLVLCAVRLRTRSVAASTLVHAAYNLSVFLSLFVTTAGYRHLDRMS